MEKTDTVKRIISIIFLLFLAVYTFFIFSYRPLMGDDFGYYVYQEISGYIDPELADQMPVKYRCDMEPGEMIGYAVRTYLSFSGRVMASVLKILYGLVNNRFFFAAAASAVYCSIVVAASSLVFGNAGKALLHPLVIVVLASNLFFYNEGAGNIFTFTILFHYGVSYLLYLLLIYIALYRVNGKDVEISAKKAAGYNILGFFAGLTHELVGLTALFMIASLSISKKGWKKGIRDIRYFIGALIGFLVCFFAPGNFNRAGTSHDAAIRDPFFQKLLRSLRQHISTIYVYDGAGFYIMVFFLLLMAAAVVAKAGRYGYRALNVKEYVSWQAVLPLSLLLWSFVSYVPNYGLLLCISVQIIACARLLYDPGKEEQQKWLEEKGNTAAGRIFGILVPAVLALLIMVDSFWIFDMRKQALDRYDRIERAVQAGEEEVYVPPFTDNISKKRVMVKGNIDNSKFYKKRFARAYYQIRVFIEE